MSMHPARQAYVEEEQEDAGVDISSIPTSHDYSIPSQSAGVPSQQASSVLNDFARKRKAAALAVPTDDKRVRTELRARGEPITLFGERAEDRRERLRGILLTEQEGTAGADEDEIMRDATHEGAGDEDDEDEEEGEFYTEGSQALLQARKDIARYSLPRAKQRIAHQRIESSIPVATHVRHRKAIQDRLKGYELFGSQIASERPLSMVRFAPNGELIACGDWGGSLKLLSIPNLENEKVLRGHRQMIGGISWVPGATLPGTTISPDSVNLASSGGEGDIHLWSLNQDTPLATLSGHTGRVCRTDIHPSTAYLASASYDYTWRLWDLATTTELLLQEGHSKEVFNVSFNGDGSLLASAGLDSIGRIWDLRTGRTVMLLEGHVAPIHALDWGVDGTRVMTGAADGFAKCWDLRAVRETASLGAHRGGVSDIRWFKGGGDGPLSGKMPEMVKKEDRGSEDVEMGGNGAEDGNDAEETSEGPTDPSSRSSEEDLVPQPKKAGTFLVTTGFDKAVNIFSADDWTLCKSLTGHDGTVLAADVAADSRWVASCGRDRTVKLWGRDDGMGI
ncbi:pre-mRNA-processing factor 4 [Hortaea werneckii]|nr:pre-mRNA-processing factor 4 [Hortaea werneckii]KAI6976486.1 pre-mRNA-processing factor 4 [Hortaea werneckii]KAI7028654.1 pre-mRNA-processing factor 4 [Hortaea werneckii]KAI7061842.1 pre-mRNA-processing factor 4 [Hortaea werneckii]KAI7124935.1 pre-mRNA-processing factor 4 [Hortaea werneckii]